MLRYCLKCGKNTENSDSKILKTKKLRTIMQSKCSVCGSKKSRFVKKAKRSRQEAKRLFSSLGLKTSLNKIPLLGDIFLLSIKWMK